MTIQNKSRPFVGRKCSPIKLSFLPRSAARRFGARLDPLADDLISRAFDRPRSRANEGVSSERTLGGSWTATSQRSLALVAALGIVRI